MLVTNYIERLMESVGKQVAKFKYTVGGVENTYITVDVAGEVRLNVAGAGDSVFRWRGKGDVATAQAELEKLVAKVGEARFNEVINRGKAKTAASANDTDWEVYSEYNTIRGNHAFTISKKVSGGKTIWKETGKNYVGVSHSDPIEKVNDKIARINTHYKLKHLTGYNHKS